MAFNLLRISITSVFFLQKGKLVLRSLLSEGRYFRGNRYFRDLLTPVTLYPFFRTFATCEGSLLSLLYGSYTTDLNISHSISMDLSHK